MYYIVTRHDVMMMKSGVVLPGLRALVGVGQTVTFIGEHGLVVKSPDLKTLG